MTFPANIQAIVDVTEEPEKTELIAALEEYMEKFSNAPDPELMARITPYATTRERVFGPYLPE